MTTTALPPDLPLPLTGFVGRERELATLSELLDESRLLTITGAGGSGKTRLALEAARRLAGTGQLSVAWVELASVSDPELLLPTLAAALGVSIEGRVSTERAIIASIRDRSVLVVLDNCEHLVEACARVAERMLQACPGLRLLATSREAFGLGGERSWLVPALSVPLEQEADDPAKAAKSEAVRLFLERARDVMPGFTITAGNAALLAQICRRLDGLPLAIELAAARINVLTLEQIAGRLDDRFALLSSRSRSALPRHRTLRATVDWSYGLLSGQEQLLLERLSVFAGGFTLSAAEQVCAGDEIAATDVLDLLGALVTRSLVTMQEDDGRARYRLLETIRDYARERARERDAESPVHARHARYFLALAQAIEPDLIAGHQRRIRQVDIEYENIRAALSWSARTMEGATTGLRLAWALMWYWYHREQWHEAYAQFETALATAIDPDAESRAAALMGLGLFGLFIRAEQKLSQARLQESVQLWRSSGNGLWLSFSLVCQSIETRMRGQHAEARRLAEEAMAVAPPEENAWAVLVASIHALVPALIAQEEWREARQRLIEGEPLVRAREDRVGLAYVLDTRAYVEMQLGHDAEAVSLACGSLRTDPREESRWLAGRSLRTLAAVMARTGRAALAVKLFAAAQSMYDAIGADSLASERGAVGDWLEKLRSDLPATQFKPAWEEGLRLTFEEALALGLGVEVEASRAVVRTTSPTPTQETELTVNALGPMEIQRGSGSGTVELRQTRPRELLLYLLSHPGGRSREEIGVDLWPEAAPAQLKNNFHVALHHLRRAIGGDLIRHDRGRYRLGADTGVEFDAGRFEQQAEQALAVLRRKAKDAQRESAAEMLAAALTLYRGPFGQGEKLGEWHFPIRDRLAGLQQEALNALALAHEARADEATAADLWRRLMALDPLHEGAVRGLMRHAAATGRRQEALRLFQKLEHDLDAELGVAPEPATIQLAQLITRTQSP